MNDRSGRIAYLGCHEASVAVSFRHRRTRASFGADYAGCDRAGRIIAIVDLRPELWRLQRNHEITAVIEVHNHGDGFEYNMQLLDTLARHITRVQS